MKNQKTLIMKMEKNIDPMLNISKIKIKPNPKKLVMKMNQNV